MILPCDNLTLRSQAAQRPAGALMQDGPGGPRIFISYATEKMLVDFLTAELDLQLRLDVLAKQLATKVDWNPYSAFRMIDAAGEGVLNYRNIQDFLRNLGHYANDQQVIGIVRRFDSDADQVVRMQEFLELVTPSDRRAVDTSYNLTNLVGRGSSPQRVRIGAGGRISPIRARSGSPLRHTAGKSASKSVRFREDMSPTKPSILVRKSASAARIGGSPLRASPPKRPLPPKLSRYSGLSRSRSPPKRIESVSRLRTSPFKSLKARDVSASIQASAEMLERSHAVPTSYVRTSPFRNGSPLRSSSPDRRSSSPVKHQVVSPSRLMPNSIAPYGIETSAL